ncbi:Fpg/Nei family DNA glycosylase [Mucilaginibacter sp. UR6-1]|uniref:DNA-formamidopyrimidine glycosylase family protein n=1 Tax=Mucilaginibacter sp. UR6-1 TaxID=1435643 RepID=UPI001E480A40|nr:DNA-formamidopyrimidine glycosylase family protein [Mucilaginibacter sp. UR6-1]MCC8409841.1 Fpg/Nei family DNA glycosylase [Mucilaginibacter sp. UR6-1]
MPELPDLQAFSHNLNKKLKGKTVKQVTAHTGKLNVSADELNHTLQHQKVEEIYRDGKELHIRFAKGDVLGLHLMLHGKLFLFEGENTNKYPIIDIQFTDDSGLTLTDFQKAATPTLNPEKKDAPDALAGEADAAFYKKILGSKKSVVKNILLDQKIIKGIGNAYADEILWHAGISPFSISNKIPADKVKALAKAVKDVLTDAEKQILKSNPDIINGEVRDFMLIHNAKKTHSPDGAEIKIKDGTRKTYYTDEQELYT